MVITVRDERAIPFECFYNNERDVLAADMLTHDLASPGHTVENTTMIVRTATQCSLLCCVQGCFQYDYEDMQCTLRAVI